MTIQYTVVMHGRVGLIVIQADISLNAKHLLWLHNRCCGHKFDYSEACTDEKGVRTQLVSL